MFDAVASTHVRIARSARATTITGRGEGTTLQFASGGYARTLRVTGSRVHHAPARAAHVDDATDVGRRTRLCRSQCMNMHQERARARPGRPGSRCSPEQIRTAVTALRGRRPGPLDDGARPIRIWAEVADFALGGEDSNPQRQDQNLLCCRLHHPRKVTAHDSRSGLSRAARVPRGGGSATGRVRASISRRTREDPAHGLRPRRTPRPSPSSASTRGPRSRAGG